MTDQYMEPTNDIIKACLNPIDNTAHAKDIVAMNSSMLSENIMSIHEYDSESGVYREYEL